MRGGRERSVLGSDAPLGLAEGDTLALLDAAPVGIAFFDRDLRYIRVNRALAEINGLAAEEHVGRRLEDVVGGLAPAADARVRMWNPAAERMFGWTEEEVLGRALPFVPEGKEGELRANLDSVLAGKAF